MKKILRSLRDRLHFTKSAKVQKGLAIALVVFLILGLGGASVSSWYKDAEKQKKDAQSINIDKDKASVKLSEKDKKSTSASNNKQTASTEQSSESKSVLAQNPTPARSAPSADKVKTTATRKEPCFDRTNELYIQYNSDISAINNEKNAALAEVDRMYNSGEFTFYNGEALGLEDQYNLWQQVRQLLTTEYDSRLKDLNIAYRSKVDSEPKCY